jgi:hypothetical protein
MDVLVHQPFQMPLIQHDHKVEQIVTAALQTLEWEQDSETKAKLAHEKTASVFLLSRLRSAIAYTRCNR